MVGDREDGNIPLLRIAERSALGARADRDASGVRARVLDAPEPYVSRAYLAMDGATARVVADAPQTVDVPIRVEPGAVAELPSAAVTVIRGSPRAAHGGNRFSLLTLLTYRLSMHSSTATWLT